MTCEECFDFTSPFNFDHTAHLPGITRGSFSGLGTTPFHGSHQLFYRPGARVQLRAWAGPHLFQAGFILDELTVTLGKDYQIHGRMSGLFDLTTRIEPLPAPKKMSGKEMVSEVYRALVAEKKKGGGCW